jgi:hypothetical protein
MSNFFVFVVALAVSLLFSACRREEANEQSRQKWSTQHSVDFNQELSVRENLKINTFLAH